MKPFCLSALLAALPLAAAGCAHMTPGEGFARVQPEIEQRTHARTTWNRSGEEDSQVQASVDDLLRAPLTADAAVQVALLNNRGLQAVYEDLDIAQADLVRAGLLANPIFRAEVRFSSSGGGTGIVLDAAEDFVSLFATPLRRARAEADYSAAQARVTRAVVDHALRTRQAFYAYRAAEDTQRLQASILEASMASLELARRLREAGNTREIDLLSEQTSFEQAKLDADTARADADLARERLNALMGLWGERTAWQPIDHLEGLPDQDEDVQAIERRAVAASLELQELRLRVDSAAAAARLARPLSWLSSAEVGAAAEREVEGGWSLGPSMAIPIPIFDSGGAASGEAAARLRQAADRYYAAAVEVRAQARALAISAQSARARALRFQTTVLPLYEQLAKETQLQYNAMQVSAFQLLSAKRDLTNASAQSIAALRDYWNAHAALQAATEGGASSRASTGVNE